MFRSTSPGRSRECGRCVSSWRTRGLTSASAWSASSWMGRTMSAISRMYGGPYWCPTLTTSRLASSFPVWRTGSGSACKTTWATTVWYATFSRCRWLQRRDNPASCALNQGQPSPAAFYQATELKPENLAAKTSRLFLGVKLECAQCHDHPFARWSRKQFWEYAAFFSGLKGQNGFFGQIQEAADRREIKIAGTDKTVQARLLDGSQPAWKTGVSTRITLANWITTSENPFFARAAVNRLWAQFFGIGLVDPVDESGDKNPPSHPELLDELTQQFVAHQFDLKFLIRAITVSRTYQLTSVGVSSSPEERRLYTRMAIKGLTPEQLFDSLAQATGYRESSRVSQPGFFGLGEPSPRNEFLTRFASQDKRTEPQTSILQALLLMNGKFVTDATSVNRSELLAGILDAPFLKDPRSASKLFTWPPSAASLGRTK